MLVIFIAHACEAHARGARRGFAPWCLINALIMQLCSDVIITYSGIPLRRTAKGHDCTVVFSEVSFTEGFSLVCLTTIFSAVQKG